MPARPLPDGERERRQQALAPVRNYLASHGFNQSWVARQLGMSPQRLNKIWCGLSVAPDGFVEQVASIIGRKPKELLAWKADRAA